MLCSSSPKVLKFQRIFDACTCFSRLCIQISSNSSLRIMHTLRYRRLASYLGRTFKIRWIVYYLLVFNPSESSKIVTIEPAEGITIVKTFLYVAFHSNNFI